MTIYTVTNNNDSGVGSLREALAFANSNLGLDTIEIAVDVNLSSALNITDDVQIFSLMGNTISQTQNDRLFNVNDGNSEIDLNVNFKGLKLTGGSPVTTGGAILSYENLSLDDVEIFGNATAKRGGGVYQEGASLLVKDSYFHNNVIAEGTTSAGGGIYVRDGELEVVDSIFEDNSAIAGGGISIVSETNAKVSGSKFYSNEGSGIFVGLNSTLDLSDSELKANKSDISGGGIGIEESSSVTITNTEISGNFAPYGGGIEILNGAKVKIVNSTITNNSSLESGGGIDVYDNSTLEVFGSTISSNSSDFGGGIASFDGTSQITLTDTVVTDNAIGNTAGDGFAIVTTDTELNKPIVNDGDLVVKGNSKDEFIQGGGGNELISGLAGDDTIRGGKGNDTLKGGNGDDRLAGNAGDDLLEGNAGADILRGRTGDDILRGGSGNDLLDGGEGDDRLIGNDGDDLLFGGVGSNSYKGGTGADTFVIESDAAVDRIYDFQIGQDIIGLSGVSYNELEIYQRANTVLVHDGNIIASVSGINASDLTVDSFKEF